MHTTLRFLMVVFCVTGFAWLTVSSGRPVFWAPYNALVLLPVWLAGSAVGLVFIPLFCVVWCFPIFRGATEVPIRTIVLAAFALAGSVLNLVLGVERGVRWQGASYTGGVAIVSVVLWVGLTLLAWWAWRQRTQFLNSLFHIALFCWLAWYALPTLGELP